ncbi:hypothetical protein I7I53_12063 [Histoplasma capsulatum var. duboisii H88]|uniref:Uncharacterized protein n=1 Tax=Ajellomyces capsulatus (strain H88) TaxID=544711 RepID=A0A8A1LUJ0_AJEC8|nr:hypothetical protein I7I53_12063 [Histoplasma capsulatum var. duboisii H88]
MEVLAIAVNCGSAVVLLLVLLVGRVSRRLLLPRRQHQPLRERRKGVTKCGVRLILYVDGMDMVGFGLFSICFLPFFFFFF